MEVCLKRHTVATYRSEGTAVREPGGGKTPTRLLLLLDTGNLLFVFPGSQDNEPKHASATHPMTSPAA